MQAHYISYCFKIFHYILQINKDDNLPKNLCETCYHKLIDFYTYKKLAESSDCKIRAYFESKSCIKLEKNIEMDIKLESPHQNNCDDYNSSQPFDSDDDLKPLILHKRDINPRMKEKGKKEKHTGSKSVKNYVCPVCLVQFQTLGDKRRHIQERHPEMGKKKPHFRCTECPRTFPKYCNLQRHMVTHAVDRPFSCTLCPESFKREYMLENHQIVHQKQIKDMKIDIHIKMEPDTFNCDLCSIEFQSQQSLSAHMAKHAKMRNLSCSECGKTFKKRSHLTRHEDIHKRTTMKCDVCHETFRNKRLLICHINRHRGVQPNICKVCSKEFSYRSTLQAHLKLHMGLAKTFLCPTCGKKFDSGNNLKHHIKRHLGEKSFACSYCPKKFVSKGEFVLFYMYLLCGRPLTHWKQNFYFQIMLLYYLVLVLLTHSFSWFIISHHSLIRSTCRPNILN